MLAFPLFRVGLLVTLRCNAFCRHCYFNAGPDRNETMLYSVGVKAITEASALRAEWISLTGGEPFLEPELSLSLVTEASKLGTHTEIVTNGFWAETRTKAKQALTPFVDAELDALNLSLDDFHAEFIPIEFVRNAYKASLELGLKPVVMVTTIKDSKITASKVAETLQDDNLQILGEPRKPSPNALVIETPVTPSGRASTLSINKLETRVFTEFRCNDPLRDIGVKPNGDVLPCCGPLASIRGMPLGNLNEQPLAQILEKASTDERFTKLREGVTTSGRFTNRCHTCLEYFRKEPFRA